MHKPKNVLASWSDRGWGGGVVNVRRTKAESQREATEARVSPAPLRSREEISRLSSQTSMSGEGRQHDCCTYAMGCRNCSSVGKNVGAVGIEASIGLAGSGREVSGACHDKHEAPQQTPKTTKNIYVNTMKLHRSFWRVLKI